MNWRDYQEETAQFFRSLGCDVEVNATIKGVRTDHEIDVWVCFNRYGLETKWVVECKYWESRVPKEKVLVLRSIVEDIGADRGILISRTGFQSGAIRAAKKSNITLTNLDDLRKTAQEDLISFLLHTIETKVVRLQHSLFNLYRVEQTSPNTTTATPLPGVDGKVLMNASGLLTIIGFGFERVKLQTPPFPFKFDDSGERIISAASLNEFIDQVSKIVSEVEATVISQYQKVAQSTTLDNGKGKPS